MRVVQTSQPTAVVILAGVLCTMFLLAMCIMVNVFRRLKRFVNYVYLHLAFLTIEYTSVVVLIIKLLFSLNHLKMI